MTVVQSFSELCKLSNLDERVLLGKFLLMFLSVVEVTLVLLCVSVLSTEDIVTLAGESKQSHFPLTEPASSFIRLSSQIRSF